MTASAGSVPGRIFMSYRREETAPYAGWLYDRLATHFSRNQIFKDDADSIELGDDFVEVINNAVGSCDVLLALIGDRWLRIADQDGQRRIDNPDDFVRLEIEAALARNVRVIPILVEGARMPRADELPESLAKLARKQALELSPSRFDFDTLRLLRVLDRTITQAQEQARQEAGAHEPADDPLVEPGTAAPRPSQPKLSSTTRAVDLGSTEAATAGQSVSSLETSAAVWHREQDQAPASVPSATADAPPLVTETAQWNPPSADVEMLPSVDRRPTQRLQLPSKTLRIGRSPDNDLFLGDDLEASPHHAELRRTPAGTYEIVDLDSQTGTFVNGHLVTRQILTEQEHRQHRPHHLPPRWR